MLFPQGQRKLSVIMRSGVRINPLSTNSDQQQFSPNDVHTLSRDKVTRINKMMTKEKMP